VRFGRIEIKELPPEDPNGPGSLVFDDPNGDCQWKRQGKRITITAPGGDKKQTSRGSSRWSKEILSPRSAYLRSNWAPIKPLSSWGEHLVVWIDDQNLLTIQRVVRVADGKSATSHASSNCIRNGKPDLGRMNSPRHDVPLRLKIERIGAKITTHYCEEGKLWQQDGSMRSRNGLTTSGSAWP